MVISPHSVFRFLADNTDLVMSLCERREVDEAELLELIGRHRSDGQAAPEHLRFQIEELAIIERAAHADGLFEVSRPVVDVLSWLTRRQRLSSATVLQGYLDEISSRGKEVGEAVRVGDPNTAALALRDLDQLVESVRVLSGGNREAVVGEAQQLRASANGVSAVERFATVTRIWQVYLEPLRQLVSIHGEMEQLLDRVRAVLDDGERRFLAHGPLQQGFSRMLARLARMRRAARDDHHAAVVEIAPLHERLRLASRWFRGASHALARIQAEGLIALKLDQRMGLTGWRTRSLISDEKLRSRFVALVGYEPQRPSLIAEAPPPPSLPLITRDAVREAIAAAVPIEDVLAFVFDRWSSYPLTTQLRAFGLIIGGSLGQVAAEGAEPRSYSVRRGQVEAWPLSLKQVAP